ncbi:unnamed protein product [Trichobilharzia szidati]|nr:unnamed protein product [Trichobilharzia szidati]CAH8842401.1 unnamed protein product [Trichobilharzia szidati]
MLFITYELIQAAFNAWSSILTSVFQEGTHGQERNSVNKPELVTSEWIKTTVLHLNSLVSKTIDSIIHVHLELDVNKNIRLSTAFARWLGVLLLKCHRLINLEDSQNLRYTVVSGLLTLAASQSSPSVSVTKEDSKEGSFLAQKILSEYTTLNNVNTNSIMDTKSLSNLFGHKLIRKVAFDSLTEQTNCLMNQLFSLLDESQLQKRCRTILGHLNVLDPEDIRTFVHSSESFQHFCFALAKFLTFDLTSVELNEHSYLLPLNYSSNSSGNNMQNSTIIRPSNLFRKPFQYFRDNSTLLLIQAITGKLASQRETIDLFLDTCRDIMDTNDHSFHASCLLLIVYGIAGYMINDNISLSERKTVCLSFMSLYFDSEILKLPTDLLYENTDNTVENNNVDISKQNTTYKSWPAIESVKNEDIPKSTEENQLKDIKINSISICLLLEMFCTISQINLLPMKTNSSKYNLEDEHFNECLRIGLLPTVSLFPRNDLIGQTARVCLNQVAVNCKYSNLNELITDNADCLVSNITLDLHRVNVLTISSNAISLSSGRRDETQQFLLSACNATNTLFEYCTIDVLPILKPMVTKMLSSLDLTYEYTTELFLPPFAQLMQTCRKWSWLLAGRCIDEMNDNVSMDKSNVQSDQVNNSCQYNNNESILSSIYQKTLDLISETRRLHHIESNGDDDDVSQEKSNNKENTNRIYDYEKQSSNHVDNEGDENKNHTFPDHLQIVEEVILRCIHLMSDGNPRLRILSMNVIKEGCLALESETELLLPIVHKIWASLMMRFRDSHAIVVEKAFDLLTILSKVAGNFIRQRASSEIIPPLVMFLTRSASISASSSKSYKYLTSHRVQKYLLHELGSLCKQTNISSQSLQSVINVLVKYLDDSQPEELQKASIFSLETVWSLDPGCTWTLLISQLNDSEIQSLYSGRLIKPFKMIQVYHQSPDLQNGKNLKFKNISTFLHKVHGICN